MVAAASSTYRPPCSASSYAKIVPNMAATIECCVWGRFTSTLRMKWARQRCQQAPGKNLAMAVLRPRCESLMASWTPYSPRPAGSGGTPSKGCVLEVADGNAEHFAAGVLRNTSRDHDGPRDDQPKNHYLALIIRI